MRRPAPVAASWASDARRKSRANSSHAANTTAMRANTNGVRRYCALPAMAGAWANAPGRLQENSAVRGPSSAIRGIISSTNTGRAHMNASGMRRRPADQRALVARCVAMKNIADTHSDSA